MGHAEVGPVGVVGGRKSKLGSGLRGFGDLERHKVGTERRRVVVNVDDFDAHPHYPEVLDRAHGDRGSDVTARANNSEPEMTSRSKRKVTSPLARTARRRKATETRNDVTSGVSGSGVTAWVNR